MFLALDIDMKDSRAELKVDRNKLLPEYDMLRKEFFDLYHTSILGQFKKVAKQNKKSLKSTGLVIKDLKVDFNIVEVIQTWIDNNSELVEELNPTNRYKWLQSLDVYFKGRLTIPNFLLKYHFSMN
jgi:hypothetical protein